MKTFKFIIFVVGICLINYVGGVPKDARNLFITHIIFLSPYLVDFYPLLALKSYMKFVITFIWGAGIAALVLNILGITGIIKIDDSQRVVFNPDYYIPLPLNLGIETILVALGFVYAAVFMGTITFKYLIALDEKISQKKTKKNKGKEMVERVHTR